MNYENETMYNISEVIDILTTKENDSIFMHRNNVIQIFTGELLYGYRGIIISNWVLNSKLSINTCCTEMLNDNRKYYYKLEEKNSAYINMNNIKNISACGLSEKRVQYYLDIADTVLKPSNCLRRKYGAVIVKNDEIISTGYNGTPRGVKHCNPCKRQQLKIASGERYELCRSVHAEANAIISANRKDMIDSVLFLSGVEYSGDNIKDITCCTMCKRLIINAGIKYVVYRVKECGTNLYKVIEVSDWIKEM